MIYKKNSFAIQFSFFLFNFVFCSIVFSQEPSSDASLRLGATVFNSCYYCHSLKPDVHLTGPSLAGLWGKKAGKVKGYELYTDGLKKSNVVWNEKSLEEWIRNPQKLVPSTTMPDPRIKDETFRQAIVEFLKIAMAKDGYEKVVSEKLITEKIANGQLPKFVREPGKFSVVKSVESCGQVYSIVLVDGAAKKVWKLNLSFKVMHGDFGPKENQPIMVPTGSMGDRFEIIFHSYKELSAMITECKTK